MGRRHRSVRVVGRVAMNGALMALVALALSLVVIARGDEGPLRRAESWVLAALDEAAASRAAP